MGRNGANGDRFDPFYFTLAAIFWQTDWSRLARHFPLEYTPWCIFKRVTKLRGRSGILAYTPGKGVPKPHLTERK
jgi:hypothetical protein